MTQGAARFACSGQSELPANWDPATDPRLTAWEMVHHLIRVLEAGGESAAAELAAKLGSKAEIARELCYRLYTLCERKKRAPKRSPTTASSRAGRRSRASRERAAQPRMQQTQMFEQE